MIFLFSMKLISVTLLIHFGLSGAAVDHLYTAHCQKCIEPCTWESETDTYKCKTDEWFKKGTKNATDWDFCSPSKKQNHLGENCTNECGFYGQEYQWCTDEYYWGYCSSETCTTNHGYSANCQKCIEPCKKDPESKTYKCKTYPFHNTLEKEITDWDWCSPSVNQTHWGENCTNQCDFHGEDYHWCINTFGTYGFCSGKSCRLEKEELADYGNSAQCQKCLKPCQKEPTTRKYKCKTYPFENLLTGNYTDWDWCSESEKQNHHGGNCTSGWDFHGEDYQWCTDKYQWGYCSKEPCTLQTPEPKDNGYSTHCKKCLKPCKIDPKSKQHKCKTDHFYNTILKNATDWDWCSSSEKHNHWGNNCTSACAFNGKDYQSCFAVDEGSGFCSGKLCKPNQEPDYGYSSYCQKCIEPCRKLQGVYWCVTQKWTLGNETRASDWCSPDSRVDFNGRLCKDKCAFKGKDYQSCEVDLNESDRGIFRIGYCSGKGSVLCNFLGNTYTYVEKNNK